MAYHRDLTDDGLSAGQIFLIAFVTICWVIWDAFLFGRLFGN